MKHIISRWLLTALLALAAGLVTAEENKAASDAVNASLMRGTSHADIIRSLTEEPHNMSLSDATVLAMNAGGDANRTAFVTAGIQAASTLPQAQSVSAAVKASAGETSAAADAADAAMQEFARLLDQPYIHHDEDIPSGGGAYNPNGGGTGGGNGGGTGGGNGGGTGGGTGGGNGGGIVGGTRPPIGGTRPPVSPSS